MGPGPAIHRALQTGVALCMTLAWASLGVQVRVLYGSRGLLPVAELMERVRGREDLGLIDLPSPFWLDASDGALVAGCALGFGLSLLALWGRAARPALVGSALLYLGYCAVGQDFLGFQWDSLLVEAGLLVAWLPRDRASPARLLLVKVLLFKIFFESGVAKALSGVGDWWSGEAMTLYYETAPIPTALGWFAHHLPEGWHRIESWWTLFFELIVPFAIFGPRRARLAAAVIFGGFLVVDTATANYGFFCPMTAVLLLALLDETDLQRVRTILRRPAPRLMPSRDTRLVQALVAIHLGLSAQGAIARFARVDPAPQLRQTVRTWRLANVYHLFGTITTSRIEPEFHVVSGGSRTALVHPWKAGPVDRAPPFVTPHQPRVDFQLWFYGLQFQRRTPTWVATLVERLCSDPQAVATLFINPPDEAADTVQLVMWDTRFSSPEERAKSGAWWTREEVHRSPEIPCP